MRASKNTESNGQQPSTSTTRTTRRDFLSKTAMTGAGLFVAAASVAASQQPSNTNGRTTKPADPSKLSGRRKLRSLEVSSVGLGVQNMSRKYETTVPYRPEMINIIRAAYDAA